MRYTHPQDWERRVSRDKEATLSRLINPSRRLQPLAAGERLTTGR